MTSSDVLAYLKKNQDARGIAHWKERDSRLKSYGVGLTKLRAFAKQIGRNPTLARRLWKSKVYEMRIVSLLVDDPKVMTMAQAESQVDELAGGHLAHVFSSCGAPLAKTSFAVELADKWIKSREKVRKRCGYGLLSEIATDKRKTAPNEDYFLAHVERVDRQYAKQSIPVLMSMAGALQGIGMRTKKLNKAAVRVAKTIGPIDFDPRGRCDPYDVAKHLTSPYATKKLDL